MSKVKQEELRNLLFELKLIDGSHWADASVSAKESGKSVWRNLQDQQLLTKKQADTLEMCGKGYIPVNVARVTVSLEKSKLFSPTRQAPADSKTEQEKSSSSGETQSAKKTQTKDNSQKKTSGNGSKTQEVHVSKSSLARKISARQANTPVQDLYKSGEIKKLDVKAPAPSKKPSDTEESETKKTRHCLAETDQSQTPPPAPGTSSRKDNELNRSKHGDLSWLVGQKLGKFQLGTQLGKGSAGTVFLAHHTALNMPGAIKILDPALAITYPELVDRFMHEARSAARINHPNVIRVLDCDCHDDLHMIVMEYVDGISLGELVTMNGPLSEDRALKYILAVAEGLEAAYRVGIIHRDIKPANILATKNKQIRVADMGLARAITEDSVMDTPHGVGLGTPQYFPPEQARDASSADHRSDIYAMGITLYVLLSGELPFKGKSLVELIRQHEEEYAIPLNVLNPSITQRSANLVIRMIEKNPKDRFQHYEELIQAIQTCVVECQTRTDDLGSSTSRSSFSMLDKIGGLFGKKK